MIKCKSCAYYLKDGYKHTCAKCKTKTQLGALIEQFIEYCPYYKNNDPTKMIKRGRKCRVI